MESPVLVALKEQLARTREQLEAEEKRIEAAEREAAEARAAKQKLLTHESVGASLAERVKNHERGKLEEFHDEDLAEVVEVFAHVKGERADPATHLRIRAALQQAHERAQAAYVEAFIDATGLHRDAKALKNLSFNRLDTSLKSMASRKHTIKLKCANRLLPIVVAVERNAKRRAARQITELATAN